MILYKENGEKINIPNNIRNLKINGGNCGSIYRYSSTTCLKIYDGIYNQNQFRMSKTLYDIIKKVPSPNIVNITELLYKERKNYYPVEAYLMDYYKKSQNNILELPIDFLLSNANSLHKFSNEMSNLSILLMDVRRNNTIITDDYIILLDPDRYLIRPNINNKDLLIANASIINHILESIVESYLKDYYSALLKKKGLNPTYVSSKLFHTFNPKNGTKVLSKKLKGCKKTIDYIYKL